MIMWSVLPLVYLKGGGPPFLTIAHYATYTVWCTEQLYLLKLFADHYVTPTPVLLSYSTIHHGACAQLLVCASMYVVPKFPTPLHDIQAIPPPTSGLFSPAKLFDFMLEEALCDSLLTINIVLSSP